MPVRNPADIAAHAALTTGVHGVGPGTIGSFSTANKTIYVDKAAAGAGDGTSWADAFTTITLVKDGEDRIYKLKVKDLYGEREQVLSHEVISTKPPQYILDRMNEAKEMKHG